MTGWNTAAIAAQGYAGTANRLAGATEWLSAYSRANKMPPRRITAIAQQVSAGSIRAHDFSPGICSRIRLSVAQQCEWIFRKSWLLFYSATVLVLNYDRLVVCCSGVDG